MRVSRVRHSTLLYLIPFVVLVGQILVFTHARVDDAFITYRYSENLVGGEGPVWNPGQDPVEGYTNFLWMVINAGGIAMEVHPLLFSKILAVLCALAIGAIVISPLNQVVRTTAGRLFVLSLVAVTPLVGFLTQSGMETVPFCLLVLLMLFLHARGSRALFVGIAGGVAALMRPEAVGVFGIVAVSEVLRKAPLRTRRLLELLVSFGAIWLPFTVWRWWFYGNLLPNTFYAKHTGGGFGQAFDGLRYLSKVPSGYILLPAVFIVAAAALKADVLRRFDVRMLLAVVGLFFVYSVVVGGDDIGAFPYGRLVLPAIFVLYLIAGAGLEQLMQTSPQGRLSVVGLAMVLLVGFSALPQAEDLVTRAIPNRTISTEAGIAFLEEDLMRDRSLYEAHPLSKWIKANIPSDRTVALPWAGEIPYYIDNPVIDMHGLNDERIAQGPKPQRGIDVKLEPEYLVGKKPDIIFINTTCDELKDGSWRDVLYKEQTKKLVSILFDSPTYELVCVPPAFGAFRHVGK